MHAVFSDMFLFPSSAVYPTRKGSKLGQLTGYCVPFTNTTRSKLSTSTGRDFSRTDKISDPSGGLKFAGYLTSCITGIAETIPWENTKEPTPMSIY